MRAQNSSCAGSLLSSPASPEYQGQSDNQHHPEHPHPSGVPPLHAISVHVVIFLCCRPASLLPASWPCVQSSSACDPSWFACDRSSHAADPSGSSCWLVPLPCDSSWRHPRQPFWPCCPSSESASAPFARASPPSAASCSSCPFRNLAQHSALAESPRAGPRESIPIVV